VGVATSKTEEDDVISAEGCESEIDWDEVDGEMQGTNSRNNVNHVEMNSQLFVIFVFYMHLT